MKKSTTILLILGALTTISPFSIDMYLSAFQDIANVFHTTVPRVSLSLSSYFVGLALGQIVYGPFLDRFGRKPPLYFGLGIYILASIACVFSPTIESLIALRFFQALGGCAAQVASVAMVRDFYPPKEGARVFSKLMLILSVSPLFAPTVGGFVVTSLGWEAVFFSLAAIVAGILLSVFLALPEGHKADPTISLHPRAIFKDLRFILKNRQFFSYALAGAFSFAGLFVYVAGASPLFMGDFQLSAHTFGLIFAGLSVGVVGGGQVNILLSYKFSGEQIFKTALSTQLGIATIFLVAATLGTLNLISHIAIFGGFLACVGLTYPNAAALALAPFDRNAGSAAALLGFFQMGIGALASAGFGLLGSQASVTMAVIFCATSAIGVLLLALRPADLTETNEFRITRRLNEEARQRDH